MKHNFDAAINSLVYEESDSHITDYNHTVLFALKFTKAALSGEVSDAVQQASLRDYLIGGNFETSFKAMCQQLAKEIG